MQNRRCTKCDKEPSGYIPRAHDFCEFCGERLPVMEPERVAAKCYRCGKAFESIAGVTICADCQAIPVSESPLPPPDLSDNRLASAALGGVLFPIAVRMVYALFGGDSSPSREMKALVGVIAFFAVLGAGAVLGVVAAFTGQQQRQPSFLEQAVAFAAFAATVAVLWALT